MIRLKKRIGIVFDERKNNARQLALEVDNWLKERGYEVFNYQSWEKLGKELDFILTFGGDGLVLHTANKIGNQGLLIPLVRVNFGKVGFMSNIEPEEVFEKLNKLLNNNYIITNRTRIEAEVNSKANQDTIKADALNDIVIERIQTRPISLQVIINKIEKIERLGDGIIFSTRTGSSAYNRSAGGPILVKEDQFVITIVSPVDLEKSSYFVRPADSVLQVNKIKGDARIVIDGDELLKLSKDDVVAIRKSPQNTLFIEFGSI